MLDGLTPPPLTPRSCPAEASEPRKRKPKQKKDKKKRAAPRPARKIEYIKVPKHWFSDPLNHALKTAVRPPTARTRRKELVITMKIPEEIFLDLLRPLESNSVTGLEWTDDKKTKLKPTKEKKTFNEYKYKISKPEVVDKIWRLHDREPTEPKGKKTGDGGEPVPWRRGHGGARLHLSHAAAERGETTDLLAQVVGTVQAELRVPHEENSMPNLRITYKVATMDENGHMIWPTAFDATAMAGLRKQMRFHLKHMIESAEYPTLTQMSSSLTQASDTVRQYAQPAQGRATL